MNDNVSAILARALLDAGAAVVTHVPGHGATEVFAAFCELDGKQHAISFHEEVAYPIAHGASLLGQRAATVIKAHGLVKAANSVLDSLSAGTTAGFLVVVFGPILASVSPGAKYDSSHGGVTQPPDPRAAAGACLR